MRKCQRHPLSNNNLILEVDLDKRIPGNRATFYCEGGGATAVLSFHINAAAAECLVTLYLGPIQRRRAAQNANSAADSCRAVPGKSHRY